MCNCKELLITDAICKTRRHEPPAFHDCEYTQRRSALVPKAERIVLDTLPRNAPPGLFMKRFMIVMEDLVEAEGLYK